MTRDSYQIGHVSDLQKSRRGEYFEIRYRVPAPNGRWKHRAERLYDVSSKKAARKILNERISKYSPRNSRIGQISFRDFVARYWKPHLEHQRVKPSTKAGYESILEKHVYPAIGDLPIVEIEPLHIEEMVTATAKKGKASRTIRNVLVVCQSVFSLAEQDEVIERSPVKKKHRPAVQHVEKTVWTAEQVRKIVDEVVAEYRPLFTLLALTAVRIGEALALQWRHFDFEKQTLKIEQSFWYGQLVSPKTKGSNRLILFGDTLGRVMTEHMGASSRIGPQDFVFSKPDGSPLHPDVVRRDVLYLALERLHIPRQKRGGGFHAFRHAAASLINQKTGNLKLAQKLLGHADISTTADTYTHTFSESERSASLALENAIFGNTCS
jgi:integrase